MSQRNEESKNNDAKLSKLMDEKTNPSRLDPVMDGFMLISSHLQKH